VPFEDNMMPVLTGLVFAVVLGTTVQNSEGLIEAFGAPETVVATDDVFFVRAGSDTTLDVLANDAGRVAGIQIVEGPSCGEVAPLSTGISYLNSAACEGEIAFTYCLDDGAECAPAEVAMRVRPAPVNVAGSHIPAKGGLVPLGLSNGQASQTRTIGQADKATTLNAFVVSLAPEARTSTLRRTEIAELMINFSTSDLAKDPMSDFTGLGSLDTGEVPLSAVRTARFLESYTEDAVVSLQKPNPS